MEKKNYSSPTLLVEQFTTSHSVADCTSQVIDEGSVYLPCTVECIISNEDNIFAPKTGSGGNWGNTPCQHVVDPGGQQAGAYYFCSYNNRPYFVWHSQAAGGGGSADFGTLTAILTAAGLSEYDRRTNPYGDFDSHGSRYVNGRSAGDVWHAGPADGDCKEQFYKLTGFSF